MTEENWKPTLPTNGCACCVICGERITSSEFIAAKPRRGPTTYAHTYCFENEQTELREGKE